jgi:hypothetical protein
MQWKKTERQKCQHNESRGAIAEATIVGAEVSHAVYQGM